MDLITLKYRIKSVISHSYQRHLGKFSSYLQPPVSDDLLIVESPELLTSSGNVYRCIVSGRTKYVRIARRHQDIKKYLREAIEDYFDISLNGENPEAKITALKDLGAPECFSRITAIESTFEKNIQSVRDGSFRDYEMMGFPSLANLDTSIDINGFFKYLHGEIADYRRNERVPFGQLQTFSINLQLATKVLAALTDVSGLIPSVSFSRIIINGVERCASIMDDAGGVPAYSIPIKDRQQLSSSFVDELSTLEVFDAICYQTDHKLKNYNVLLDENGVLKEVRAFDNDCPTTFLPYGIIPRRVSLNPGYSSIVVKRQFNRPYINRSFARKLSEIAYEDLHSALKEILTEKQIRAIYQRIRIIDDSLRNRVQDDSLFTLDKRLDMDDICQDRGTYGSTYLYYFMTVDETQYYPK